MTFFRLLFLSFSFSYFFFHSSAVSSRFTETVFLIVFALRSKTRRRQLLCNSRLNTTVRERWGNICHFFSNVQVPQLRFLPKPHSLVLPRALPGSLKRNSSLSDSSSQRLDLPHQLSPERKALENPLGFKTKPSALMGNKVSPRSFSWSGIHHRVAHTSA